MARKAAVALAVMMTVLLALAAPSWAHHKAGHGGGAGRPAHAGSGSGSNGKAGGTSSSGYTEDNDTNDNGTPNNVSDAGDNAHPSGKDKSVEPGNSGNQGNSSSDPDDDGRGPDRSNGGADKPNGPGGVDLADQDGNNGCGNDDDFEDDNEGWCGKPKDKVKDKDVPEDEVAGTDTKKDVCVKGDEMNGDVECGPKVEGDEGALDLLIDLDASLGDEVLGEQIERPADEVAGTDDTSYVQPLAREATAPESTEEGGTLPFTGASLFVFILLGSAAVSAGLVLMRVRATN